MIAQVHEGEQVAYVRDVTDSSVQQSKIGEGDGSLLWSGTGVLAF